MPTYNDGVPVSATPSIDTTISIYGYTSAALIEGLYAQLGLSNILDDLSTAADEDGYSERDYIIRQFIRDAEQSIIIRLSKFFAPLDMLGDDWIESRATWIAAYYISKRRGNEHYFQDMYDDALRELDAIATGELSPPVDIPLRDFTYPAMSNFTIDDRFGVAKVRVRPTISYGGPVADQDIAFGYFWGWI